MVLLPVANLQEMATVSEGGRSGEAGYGGGEGSGGSVSSGGGETPISYHALVEAGRQAVMKAFCEAGVYRGSALEFEKLILLEEVIDPIEWQER
jgi:hypothetical protein